ncbi:MAG: murein transglycosylase [Flavobacteriaceae bacterium CG_4_8_14_3_um_filter_34_10]|nr:lytic transglycosylase domain-containing protein [Flavobacteriia bacterium]OIP51673.1 MAG: murein transglycosylase [Flavobacteriaceae bacterium CG2_30_34_30]PIQ17276.1 MAG: murein transglycosylase [Flavobacteriaceae bacterium CG18_big_fil_WC_8_21_14_2_50_34_36]PIV48615.1 MAG: murein transglycosylase [Flavobacteriaceae bacterium CG02_land_8_20_14_3_00_34_13]PIX10104.1 MAG: murein transglycosylase [Flavobacteriaceae bacterium CG_4_8_14_3_um_filter_34_10]PIZ07068.1 MAG: murein transglycosylase
MKTAYKISFGILLIAISGLLVFAVQEAPTDDIFSAKRINDYNIYAIPMPEKLDFAGEEVPLNDPDIRERMDRELLVNTYWQSNGLLMFKRANKAFPVMEPILKKYGIPDDFKYLAVIESGLLNVVSPAGARGIWQIMPKTAKEFGLEVNENVDERYDLEKATEAACKYILASKQQFGTWTEAAAAYNAGNTGISRRLGEQRVENYYDLLLGEETGRYVFRILALKEIMSNPVLYGFNFREKDLYTLVPSYKIEVDSAITDLSAFALQNGINYKILKIHNPWLREAKLNNKSRKKYNIEIPEKGHYRIGK